MRRRDFIQGFVGTITAWPFAARGQQPSKMPTIGYLAALSEAADRPRRAAFAKRLGELGWIENSNVRIDCRWANGIVGNAATIAAEFVRSKVDVIVSSGDTYVLAVRRATSTIPIVFASAGDPVGNGLVQSMARPGGNVTGLSIELTESVGKRLEILREIVPGLRRLAILFNAGDPLVNAWPLADIETAPRNVRFQGGVIATVAGAARNVGGRPPMGISTSPYSR